MEDAASLRALLETLDPRARHDLGRVLIRDQADRDAVSRLYGWPQTFVRRPTKGRCG
jgi:hypothetical protein